MPSDGAFGLVRLIITTWGGFHGLFFFLFKRKFPLAALAVSSPHLFSLARILLLL